MAASEAAPELTAGQAAEFKGVIASILLPGETVTRALRRLRPAHQARTGKQGAFRCWPRPVNHDVSALPGQSTRFRQAWRFLTGLW